MWFRIIYCWGHPQNNILNYCTHSNRLINLLLHFNLSSCILILTYVVLAQGDVDGLHHLVLDAVAGCDHVLPVHWPEVKYIG